MKKFQNFIFSTVAIILLGFINLIEKGLTWLLNIYESINKRIMNDLNQSSENNSPKMEPIDLFLRDSPSSIDGLDVNVVNESSIDGETVNQSSSELNNTLNPLFNTARYIELLILDQKELIFLEDSRTKELLNLEALAEFQILFQSRELYQLLIEAFLNGNLSDNEFVTYFFFLYKSSQTLFDFVKSDFALLTNLKCYRDSEKFGLALQKLSILCDYRLESLKFNSRSDFEFKIQVKKIYSELENFN
jgi:hypothetical protein